MARRAIKDICLLSGKWKLQLKPEFIGQYLKNRETSYVKPREPDGPIGFPISDKQGCPTITRPRDCGGTHCCWARPRWCYQVAVALEPHRHGPLASKLAGGYVLDGSWDGRVSLGVVVERVDCSSIGCTRLLSFLFWPVPPILSLWMIATWKDPQAIRRPTKR